MKLQFLTQNLDLKFKVESFLKDWNSDSDSFVTQTSGSTGKPKEIKIQKTHALQSAQNTIDFLGLKPSDVSFLCLNPATIGGKMMLVRAIALNQTIVIGDVNGNPLKKVKEKIDFIALAPIQLQTILEENPEKLKTIKHIIVGGGIISEPLIALLKKKELSVYQTFGMTETISHIALRLVGEQTDENYSLVPNIHISTRENQLFISAPSLGIEELKTTDIIEIRNENSFKWLGRADFVINSGGVKIHPETVEELLATKIDVPFFITGMKDEKLGERVVLFLESSKDAKYSEKSFYVALPKYHAPKEVYFLEKFERTVSGKINRLETKSITKLSTRFKI